MSSSSQAQSGSLVQPSPVKSEESMYMDISFGPSPAKPASSGVQHSSPLKPLHQLATIHGPPRSKSVPYTYTGSPKYGVVPSWHHRDGKENVSLSSSDNSSSSISAGATANSSTSSRPRSSEPTPSTTGGPGEVLEGTQSKCLNTRPIPSLIGPNDLPYAFNPSGINAFNFKDTNLRFDSLIWSDNRAALTDTAPVIEEHHHRLHDGTPSQLRPSSTGDRGAGRRGRGRGGRGSHTAAISPIEEGAPTSNYVPVEQSMFNGLYPASLDAPYHFYGPVQWHSGISAYPVDYRCWNAIPPPSFPPGYVPQSTLQPWAKPFIVGEQQRQPHEEHQERYQHQRVSTAQRFATASAASAPSWTPPRPSNTRAVAYQPLMDLPPAQAQSHELAASDHHADTSSANYTMSPEQGRWVNNLLGDASITESLKEEGLFDSELSGDNMNGSGSQEIAARLNSDDTSVSLGSTSSHPSFDISHEGEQFKTTLFKGSGDVAHGHGKDRGHGVHRSPDQQPGRHFEADVFTA